MNNYLFADYVTDDNSGADERLQSEPWNGHLCPTTEIFHPGIAPPSAKHMVPPHPEVGHAMVMFSLSKVINVLNINVKNMNNTSYVRAMMSTWRSCIQAWLVHKDGYYFLEISILVLFLVAGKPRNSQSAS